MSANSKIEWTDATWNPLLGCAKCSAGCQFCYAIRTAWRLQHNPNATVAAAYAGLVAQRADGSLNWTGKINLLPERLREPLGWTKPRRVFVNSQSDLFHEDVPEEFVMQVFAVMAACPRHTFQVLTKRPARMRAFVTKLGKSIAPLEAAARALGRSFQFEGLSLLRWPLPNVWLGVSVEDQGAADGRIPDLLATPAVVRFLSCEPLLEEVDIEWGFPTTDPVLLATMVTNPAEGINWVICGGESGPGARPMHPQWARSLRDQCDAAGVPFFFKQWGEWLPFGHSYDVCGDPRYIAGKMDQMFVDPVHGAFRLASNSLNSKQTVQRKGIAMNCVGKKAAGRLLDGREHNAFPTGR